MSATGKQSFFEHLYELKGRLVKIAWAILIGSAIAFYFIEPLLFYMKKPISPYLPTGGLVFTAPSDKFIAYLKVSLFAGMIISCPAWIFQIWKFIEPALYDNEKKYAKRFMTSAISLFIIGVTFAYLLALPAAFHFLMTFGGDADKPMITISEYFSFFLITSLMFGIAFELPVVLVILGAMGILSSKFLSEKRRIAILVLAVLSAVLTPPDVLSMLLMLVPLYILYEISIVIIKGMEKRRGLT
jgi:sec-independent protein translocase protein TatC